MNLLQVVKNNRLTAAGAVILAILFFMALFAPFLAPHDPWHYYQSFLPPSVDHLLGTNDVGQDIFSELVFAGRVSLSVGFLAALIATFIGVSAGTLAGFRRGILDNILMGMTDVALVVPALPLIILISVYIGPGFFNIALVIGLILWPVMARVVRSRVLSLRESGYVESARALGAGNWWIMTRHVLPNALPIIAAKFVLTLASAMLIEASISFLGLGDPSAKSWGSILHYAFSRGGFIREMWWWYLPPGLLIGLSIFGLNLINLGFEDKGDPRLKRMLER